jgi:spermidine synthase
MMRTRLVLPIGSREIMLPPNAAQLRTDNTLQSKLNMRNGAIEMRRAKAETYHELLLFMPHQTHKELAEMMFLVGLK